MATFGSTPISSEFVHIRIGSDLAFLKGHHEGGVRARAAGETVLDHDFIREPPSASMRSARTRCRRTGPASASVRAGGSADPPLRRHLHALERDHHLLRHGHHPAPAGLAAGAADREPAAAQGQFRQARRRHLADPRAFQRAGRPHRRHRRNPAGLPRPRARRGCSASSRRASPATTIESVEAMLAGTAKVFIGLGGNFVRAVPDTDRAYAAMAKLDLTVGIATKLNRGHLVHGKDALILPVVARSERIRTAKGEQFVTIEDSMSERHRLAGRAGTGQPRPADGNRDRLPHGDGDAAAQQARLGALHRRLRRDPRRDRRGVPGHLTPASTARSATRGNFHLDVAPRRRVWPPNGKRTSSRCRACTRTRKSTTRRCCASPPCVRTTSSTPPSTATATATAACHNDRMVLFMNAQDIADRGRERIRQDRCFETISDGHRRRVDGSTCSITRCRAVRSPAARTQPADPLDARPVSSAPGVKIGTGAGRRVTRINAASGSR